MGALKFQNPVAICFYVSDVLFAAYFVCMNYFLPFLWEVIFP